MARDVRSPCSIHCADKEHSDPKKNRLPESGNHVYSVDRSWQAMWIQFNSKNRLGEYKLIQCTHARDWHVPPEGVFEGFTIQKVRSQEIHVATFRRTSVAKLDNGKTYIRLDNQPTLVFQVEPFLGQVARPDETRPDETTSINSWIRTTQARNTEKRFPDLSWIVHNHLN